MSKRKGLRSVVAVLLLLSVVLLIGWITSQGLTPPPKSSGRTLKITVPKGSSAAEIGELLASKKVVKNALVFRAYVRYQDVGSKLRPGSYTLREGMDYDTVIDLLVEGPPQTYFTITIPEGFTVAQIGQRLSTETKIDGDEFAQYALLRSAVFSSDFAFLASNPTSSLEGYLFPKTYNVRKTADAVEFTKLLLRQFANETQSFDWKAAQASGFTPHQVVTVASLVEREARLPSERPIIAGVIYNRLRKGMPLQVDATVQYALPAWKDRLTYDDLKVDSPYNTYLRKGLPPGPISNPGISSLQAALRPARVDYLYYVVADPTGRHAFSRTLEEHNRAKANSKK